MELENKRLQLQSNLRELRKVNYIINDDQLLNLVTNLEISIRKNQYKILVLGEFKRGKSTFVNALLEEPILPMDVLPETATLNEIIYSDEPFVKVYYINGMVEEGSLTPEFLHQFSANAENSRAELVDKIQIGYPVSFLENKITLVDTPGVADLDDTRCDVTYNILPTANAVIFVLDANTPLTNSECEFITERVLPLGVNNILFLLNKYDFVDEEEDDDFLEAIEQRLKETFMNDDGSSLVENIKLLPVSSKMALEGYINHDNKLVEYSGLKNVKSILNEMLSKGAIEAQKIQIYETKYTIILNHILKSLNEDISMKSMSVQDLEKVSISLKNLIDSKSEVNVKLSRYIDSMRSMISSMTQTSIKTFQESLINSVHEKIDEYVGTQLDKFVDQIIQKYVKKECESWIANNSGNIQTLLKKLEEEIAIGLRDAFDDNINLNTQIENVSVETLKINSIEAENLQKVEYITLGAGTAALAAVGLVLSATPVMAAGALGAYFFKDKFQNWILNDKLKSARAELYPKLDVAIIECINSIFVELEAYISKQCELIEVNANKSCELMLSRYEKKINEEIDIKNKETSLEINQLESMKLCYNDLKSFLLKGDI